MKTLKLIAATTLSVFLLAACGNTDKMESDKMEPTTEMMDDKKDDMMDDKKDDMMDDKKDEKMDGEDN